MMTKPKDFIEVSFYPSGRLRREAPYVNGKLHGVYKAYYPLGTLSWESPNVNGKKHGVYKYYLESGALAWKNHYVNGSPSKQRMGTNL